MVTAVVVAGVVLVAGGGTLAMGSILKDDPGSATAAPTTSTSVSTGASPTSPSTPSSTTSASPSPSAPDPAAAVAEVKAACVAQVSAAEGIAAAAKNSATHWKAHTDAYLEKKAGQYTLAQTQAQYAASKAFGLADEKAMAATTKAFMATGAACSEAAQTAPADAAITACTTRLKALGAVRTTGTRVQDEWSAHLRMMDKKAHTDEGAYFKMWVRAVNYAQKSVPAYAAAAATVAKAPACA